MIPRWRTVLPLLLALLTATAATAQEPSALAGPGFTDPARQIPMPQEWLQRPIVYPDRLKGTDLAVSLDQQIYRMLAPAIQRYAQQHNLRIALREGTCGISAGVLIRKQADMAGFCCPPGETDRLPGVTFHTLGIGAIAIITHPALSVDNLTLEELRSIFQGHHYRWSELNDSQGRPGPRQTIRTVGRLHCKLRPGHWRLLLDNADLFGPRMQEVGTIPDMILQVAQTPGAIGYETLLHVNGNRSLGEVREMTIDGVSPGDGQALAEGRYPLYRTFNVTTWSGSALRNPHAENLLAFMMSAFQRLSPQFGTVPASALREQGWRFLGNELVGGPNAPAPPPPPATGDDAPPVPEEATTDPTQTTAGESLPASTADAPPGEAPAGPDAAPPPPRDTPASPIPPAPARATPPSTDPDAPAVH